MPFIYNENENHGNNKHRIQDNYIVIRHDIIKLLEEKNIGKTFSDIIIAIFS